MNKFKNQILIIMFFIMLVMPIGAMVKAAGSFSVKVSPATASVGSTVTVYVTANKAYGTFSVSSSDPSKLAYISGDETWFDYPGEINGTKVYKFKAKAAGNVLINVSPIKLLSEEDDSPIKNSQSKNITINPPRTLSTDNYLSSLTVEGKELVPSFDKDTDTYIVDLEPGTTKIKVDAEKANRYASVSGTGEIEVVEGNNDIEVVVTAENGSKRTYHITAVVKEYDPINKTVNGSDYTVVRKSSELTKPDKYEETTVDIDGNKIPAFYNSITGYTLVGMKDVTGTVKMFIYNNGTFTPYMALSFKKLDLIILDADSIPKGFVKDTITINDEIVTCYKNNELNITLLYGKSILTGENSFYSFENTDFTIQKFNSESYDLVNEKIELYTYMILGLGVLNLLILLCLIISMVKNKKKLKHEKVELEKTMNLDITAVKKASEPNKKEVKKQEKLRKKEEEKQRILEEEKAEALKEAEEEKKRLEAKNQKKLAKQEKKNKKSKQKDDDMFYL